MTDAQPKKSDLGVRTASAVMMLGVAGTALWLGGWVWTGFVALVALGVLWEWLRLVHRITPIPIARGLWNAGGIAYVGIGAAVLAYTRLDGSDENGLLQIVMLLGAVIATDVGAYFAGRTFGGPKIAPKISPSKTWSGLVGGAIGATVLLVTISWAWPAGLCEAYIQSLRELPPQSGVFRFDDRCHLVIPSISTLAIQAPVLGSIVAIVAQAGDFFESWMKRRAGAKDSSQLIPGHGGLFDRVDGLLSVCFVIGVGHLLLRASGL